MHVRNFITVEFLLFIKSQFATSAQSVVPFRISREGCEWSDRHKKGDGEVFLYVQLELKKTRIFTCPTDKKKLNN